jgi:hypothetical protein
MNLKTQRTLAFCNIILIIIILMDYFLPSRVMPIQELDSFYNTTVKISDGRLSSFVDRSIILLSNGETFRLGKIPERDYAKGQKIQIVKSSFSENIKEIIILGKLSNVEQVGILSFQLPRICLTISIVICLLNLFYNLKFLNILLVLSTMFTFIFSVGYLFK